MTRRCDYAWRLVLIPLTVLTVLADARQVLAVPFVYSFDGTGTGTLDVFSFTNAAFHIKTYGDTADVVGAAGGRFELRNPTIVTTIDIGFAHGTFLIPTRLFDNQTLAALGLSRAHAPLTMRISSIFPTLLSRHMICEQRSAPSSLPRHSP